MHPLLVRNVIYPTFRFLRRDGILSTLKELEQNQWRSQQELKELQWQKLSRLLKHAYATVPYYRKVLDELGLVPSAIQTPADFSRIPILTKELIRENKKDLISTAPDAQKRMHPVDTGGSTGEPLYFYRDKGAKPFSGASVIRSHRWCSVDIGDKEALLWGGHFDIPWQEAWINRAKEHFNNKIYLSTFDMSDKSLAQYTEILKRYKPALLTGYPSALYTFANFLKAREIHSICPRAVISTGEPIFGFHEELLGQVFSCKVFERYGANETGNIAQECEHHQGLHIFTDLHYVEVLKESGPAQPGEMGEIIVTDLHNYSMPFIRYRIGDLGILAGDQCGCGRSFPTFEKIEGRSFDMVTTASGMTLGGFFWTYMSRSVAGIKQFQIRQEDWSSITFYIVPDEDFKEDSLSSLDRKIKEKCGNSFHVDFKLVEDIPVAPSGKHRFIISEVTTGRLLGHL